MKDKPFLHRIIPPWTAGRVPISLLIGGLLAACDTTPTTPPDAQSLEEASATADLSGTWDWSDVEQLTMPPFVAQFIFGIQPEGPITHVRCESTGILTLFQSGVDFSGSANRTTLCETKGGFIFSPPPIASPPLLDIQEGSIRGNAIDFHFVFGGGAGICPFHGLISDVEGGVANELSATGRCIVPGHPLSPVPLDPPPAGTSKIVDLEAVRP